MIVRVNAAPIADAGPDQVGDPGQQLVFDASRSIDPDGRIARYEWDMGDGTRATGPRVSHAFARPGLYSVALTVQDETGHDAAVDFDEVLVRINALPVADAGPDRLIQPGETLTFTATNSFDPDGQIAQYRWDFSHLSDPIFERDPQTTFEDPGIYTAQLTVTDDGGTLDASAIDEVTIRVNHAPVADAGSEIRTDQTTVIFDGSGSTDADGDLLVYRWDPGDGSEPLIGRVVTHTYSRGGIFPVSLTVDDGTQLANARSADATQVVIDRRPIANAGGNRDVCSGETIPFDGSDSIDPDGGLLRYSWDFGDQTRQEIVNPVKAYQKPGTYTVTLTVEDESGSSRGSHSDRVAVVVREGPIANAGADLQGCTNQTLRFDGSKSTDSDGAVNVFSWNFGDGSSAGGDRPTHVYDKAGEYRVVLTIRGDAAGNCPAVDTDEATVRIVDAPKLEIAGAGRVASGVPFELRALVDGGAPDGISLTWDFGDGTVIEGPTATHTYLSAGPKVVSLVGRPTVSNGGCGQIDTRKRILVNAVPQPQFTARSAAAVLEEVLFDASASVDPDGTITRFVWDFGDGNTATGVQASHRYDTPGQYQVRLTVSDDAGVSNSDATIVKPITVNPTPMAALQAPPAICPGVPRQWKSADPGVSVNWAFGDGATATGPTVTHAFSKPGVYPVAATIDDGRGLANSVRTETSILRVNQAPIAKAGPDQVVCPAQVVRFDAGGSADPDGQIASYQWRFADGVVLDGPVVERAFETPGSYAAELVVMDDTGLSCGISTDTARIRVNAAPIVRAGEPRSVFTGAVHDIVTLSPDQVDDPDGDGLQLTWAMGDGTERTGTTVRHRYVEPGVYTLRLEARDGTGLACGIAADETTISVKARPAQQE